MRLFFIKWYLIVKLFEDGLNVFEFIIGCKISMIEKVFC